MESKLKSEDFGEIDLTQLLKVLLKRKWMIFALTLIALVISIILNYFVFSPVYEANTVLMIANPTEQQYYPAREEQSLEGLARTLATLPQMTLKTYEGQLKNERLLKSLVKDLNLNEEKYTIKYLKKNISTNVVKDTSLLEIKVNNHDPVLAALIANTLSNNFIDFISEKSLERIEQSRQIFQEQIVSIEQQLVQAKKTLNDFTSQFRNISYLEEELRLKQEILDVNRRALIASKNEAYYRPIISRIAIEIDELQSELIKKQWEHQRQIQEIERLEKNYNLFADQISQTQIFESIDIGKSNVMIVAKAFEPTIPVSPKKGQNIAITLGVTLLLGIALAFILELFDNRITDIEDVKNHLGLPVLGKVPTIKYKSKNKKQKLITFLNPKSAQAETFRTIRTNLYYENMNHCFKKILITSVGPGEGKSTVLSNLAVVMAQSGKRILLVDADLRRPALHRIFEIENLLGLSNFLEEKMSLIDVMQKTKIENLDIVTSGPIPLYPLELLSFGKIEQLFEEVIKDYDYILLDTPPIANVTDATVLAEKVDGVLMVINSNMVTIDLVHYSIEMLNRAKTKVIGVILNNAQYGKEFYRFYHDYGN
ncbi:MAG: polysaccharide biosynthesis tyrosine autokinase [Peptococcales bacterium]|jgi:succinoglycan biosynthesis transport protein ExoP